MNGYIYIMWTLNNKHSFFYNIYEEDETNIRKHINNIFKSFEVDKNNNLQEMRVDGVKQSVAFG